MRVGIVGAGAIGTLFGASLAPGVDVKLLVRTKRDARAVASRGGLVLDDGPPRPVEVSEEPEILRGCEAVLVCVKTYATVAALAALRESAAAATVFVSVQNGIDAAGQFEFALGHRCGIALAPTTEGVLRSACGVARRAGSGATRIGWARGHARDDASLARLVEAFGTALAIEHVADVEPYAWGKLVVNAAINPLTALAGVANGAIAERPELRERAARIAREVAAVATRRNVVLPFPDPVAYVESVSRATALNRSSMLNDLAAGRPTEIDAINGAVVRLAHAAGIAVPENERVLAEVKART